MRNALLALLASVAVGVLPATAGFVMRPAMHGHPSGGAGQAPVNTAIPQIAGLDYPNNGTSAAVTGTTLSLTANPGQWTNGTTFAYNWHFVGGPTLGTSPTLTLNTTTAGVLGSALEVDVTATASGGLTATTTSHWFGPIEASAPVAPVAYETQNPAPTSIPLPASPAHFLQCYGPGTFQHAVFPGGAIPPCAPNLTPSNVFRFDPINGQTEAAMIAAGVPTASLGRAGHPFKDLNAFFDDQSLAGYSGALFGRLIPAGATVYVEPGDATHPVGSIVSGNPQWSTSDGTATGTPVFTWVMADPASARPVLVTNAANLGAIYLIHGDRGFIYENLNIEPAVTDALDHAITIGGTATAPAQDVLFEGIHVSGWTSHSDDSWPGSYPTTGGQSNGDVTTATPAIPATGLQDGEVVVATMAQGATTFSGASTALVGRYLWSNGYYRDTNDFIAGGSSGIPNGTKILSVDGTGVATIGPCDPVADAATGCPSTPIPGCDPLVTLRGLTFGGCPAGTRPAWSGATRAINGERLQTTEQMRVLPAGYWDSNDWGTGFITGFLADGAATAGANPAAPNVLVGTSFISVKDSWFRDVGNAIQFTNTTNSIVYDSRGKLLSRDFIDNYSNHRLWTVRNLASDPTQIWDHQDAIQHGDADGTGHQILYGNADIENEFIQQTDSTNQFPRSWQGINTTDNVWWGTYVADNIVYANTNGVSVSGQYNVNVQNDVFGSSINVNFQHKAPDGLPIHSLLANNVANGVSRDALNATACSPTTGDLDTIEGNINVPFVPLGGPANSGDYCTIGSTGAVTSGAAPGVYAGLETWTQTDWRNGQSGISPLFTNYNPLPPPAAPAPGAGLWFNTSLFTALDLHPNPSFSGFTGTIAMNVQFPQNLPSGQPDGTLAVVTASVGTALEGVWQACASCSLSTNGTTIHWQFVSANYNPGVIGAGTNLGAQQPIADYNGNAFANPPSAGAYEGQNGLPAGVLLQAIDGECFGTWSSSCTRTSAVVATQTHNFYNGNGYTFATSAPNGQFSMDDPRFFSIFDDYGCNCSPSLPVTNLTNIYINGTDNITNNSDYNTIAASTLYVIPGGYGPTGASSTPEWPASFPPIPNNVVGIHLDELCCVANLAQIDIGGTTDSYQTHRFWEWTATWQNLQSGQAVGQSWDVALSQAYTTPLGAIQHMGGFAIDIYWFAASSGGNGFYNDVCSGIALDYPMDGGGTNIGSADLCRRGSHYGNMIDSERSWANNTNSGNGSSALGLSAVSSRIPLSAWVENGTALLTGARVPLPAEMNWAVWSSIIHGAREINYFYQGFDTTVQSGQTLSLQTQAPITNLLVKQLAPVLNAPFAKGFASATPHGYTFPTYEQNWVNGGIETATHWYQGGSVTNAGLALSNGFYVFSDTRYGETSGTFPATATFTVAKYAGMATTIPVVGEGRSVSAVCGSTTCTFSDTFAHAWTVHIYGPI